MDVEAFKYENIKEKLDELTILYEMMRIAQTYTNLDEILKGIVTYLQEFFMDDQLTLFLMNEKTKKFISYPPRNLSEEDLNELKIFSNLSSQNLIKMERLNFEKVIIPIIFGEKFIGLIGTLDHQSVAEKSLHLLKIVSNHLASIIENVRSEERYRAVVERALDGVMVLGEDERLNYVNDTMAAILGYSREEMVGRHIEEFIGEEGRKLINKHRNGDKDGGESSPRYELKVTRKDGEDRFIEINSTTVTDSEGNQNIIAFLKDITEKKKMEAQLFQAEKLRAIADLASGVAHDFNNALSIILGNIQLLQLTIEDPQVQDTLKIIEKITKDCAHKVRQLNIFTKDRSYAKIQLSETLDVNAIVREAINYTRSKWEDENRKNGINIDMVCDLKEVPPTKGDHSELREVITSLIINAIEAMPLGGRIEIHTFSKGSKIYIQVSDTGIGMGEDTIEKIFEPFFTTKPFTHSGLGLSMCYGIIKSYGGEIDVESQKGKGTKFTISLPVRTSGDLIKECKGEELLKEKTIKKAKILVIEDEELIRNMLVQGLTRENHQVTVAKDGIEGIDLFRKMKFDIVLTDLGMPNLSGWEVCKTVKKMSPNTPVGMITGWGEIVNPTNQREEGPDFILAKPFDFGCIVNKINEILNPSCPK